MLARSLKDVSFVADTSESMHVRSPEARRFDVVVVGGFGRVGLPLAVTFAAHGKRVCALDVDADRLPADYREPGICRSKSAGANRCLCER